MVRVWVCEGVEGREEVRVFVEVRVCDKVGMVTWLRY